MLDPEKNNSAFHSGAWQSYIFHKEIMDCTSCPFGLIFGLVSVIEVVNFLLKNKGKRIRRDGLCTETSLPS